MTRNISLSVSFLLLAVFASFAQDPVADAEKLKAERRAKLIDAIMADASQLRLPENRALVAAKLGAAIWKTDTKRGNELFGNAVGELIAAQNIAEENKAPNHQFHDLLNSQSLRPLVLNTIAAADAELALESLYRSRPSAVQKALAAAGNIGEKIGNSSQNYPYLAQQEVNLEQRLIRMIAEQKPERSLAFLKESVKKQLSGETLTMLKKIWETDPVTGNELANDVADRLISRPFFGSNNQANYDLIQLSNTILTEYVRERSPEERYINFDESRMRSLAGKLIGAYVERGGAMGYIPLQQLEPIAKRFSPGSYARLQKASESVYGFGHRGRGYGDPEYTKLMQGNPTAETLIAEAKKFPVETRRSIYSNAANMLSGAGQYERAVALLNDNFEDDALENAISSLNWSYTHSLINRGEYDAAESLILQFNDNNRISALASLANNIYNKNPQENKARANGILQQAQSFLPDRPETSNEMSQLMQLISTMAHIEPSEAFRNFEPLVEQINQLSEAWAVVNAFQGGGNIRQGEYYLSGGHNFGVHIDPSLFAAFAQKDFARTMSLIESFRQRETRILLLIGLLERGI